MKETKMPYAIPLAIGLLLLAAVLVLLPGGFLFDLGWNRGGGNAGGDNDDPWGKGPRPEEAAEDTGTAKSDPTDAMLAALLAQLASRHSPDDEAILRFKDEEAMKAFLARAEAAGLKVLGTLDRANAVRVGFDSLADLRRDMQQHLGDYAGADGNYYVYMPDVPQENRAQQAEVGFGEGALAFMGIKGDFSTFGKGVTIAILDSGVAAHSTFAGARLRHLDIGEGITGTTDADGHATAVAALAAGSGTGATGVAPAADILSIRVTGPDGTSDLFTLAAGIEAAVNAGAKVINISLGAYQNSSLLTQAIDYAYANGAVIVAAAGNDQAAQLTYPAADPRVISVGAVDALGQQLTFSNSGSQLQATAPGLDLQTAWPGDQIVSFDGTSGASPLMAGAIAAVMSQYPNLSAQQASQLLTTYSADAGAPGRDASFGWGTVDVGYAINYNNTAYSDPSISSQYFNSDQGQMEFVVQNRSASPALGLNLTVNAAGTLNNIQVPNLEAGQRWSYTVPVDASRLLSEGELTYSSRLNVPQTITDQNPGNNRKGSVVFRPDSAAQ
jgi:Subtilase family